jgi:hypothetical protein
LNIKISINKKGFISARWSDCFVTMNDIFALGNELRRRSGLRPMSKPVFYLTRMAFADEWLDKRIRLFRHDADKWRGNPYLAYRTVGRGYCFRHKNADHILSAMVGYRLQKPRGRAVAKCKRRKLAAA